MSLYLQGFDALNKSKDVFNVNASFPLHESMTTSKLSRDWAETTANRSSIIPGSINLGGRAHNGQMVSFLAKQNTPSISSDAAGDRFSCIAANIFMDKSDKSTWRMENGRLVQSAKDDLGELLASRLARTSGTMIFASSSLPFNHGIRPSLFDFGLFYNTEARRLDSGWMITEGNQVLVSSLDGDGHMVVTDPATVLATLNLRQQPQDSLPDSIKAGMRHVDDMINDAREKQYVAQASRYGRVEPGNPGVKMPESAPNNGYPHSGDFTAKLAQQALNYMGGLYAGSNFYKQLEAWIKHRRNVAGEDLPLTTMRAAG